MRIGPHRAESEFHHVAAADDHRTGGAQARDRGRIGRRGRRIGEDFRARPRDITADVEQILHRDGQPVYWRAQDPGLAQPVRLVGIGARRVRIDLDEGARALARRRGDALQGRFHQRAAGAAARGEFR